jgi:hypothetical protein
VNRAFGAGFCLYHLFPRGQDWGSNGPASRRTALRKAADKMAIVYRYDCLLICQCGLITAVFARRGRRAPHPRIRQGEYAPLLPRFPVSALVRFPEGRF